MKRFLLVVCLIGVAVPYAFLLPWIAKNGLDVGLLTRQIMTHPISAFLVADVVVSALAVIGMAAQGVSRGDMRMVWPIVGTLTVGVSLGLPLYLLIDRSSPPARSA
ncbi:MAG: hypothetical protein Kow0056_11500 [Coriobacteriia bacterium]